LIYRHVFRVFAADNNLADEDEPRDKASCFPVSDTIEKLMLYCVLTN